MQWLPEERQIVKVKKHHCPEGRLANYDCSSQGRKMFPFPCPEGRKMFTSAIKAMYNNAVKYHYYMRKLLKLKAYGMFKIS